MNDEVRELLESQAVHWKRDWDAVAIGYVLGILTVLAIQGLW